MSKQFLKPEKFCKLILKHTGGGPDDPFQNKYVHLSSGFASANIRLLAQNIESDI